MNTGVVSMRYAKALLSYAKEQGAESAIYGNMLQLLHTLQSVKELSVMLASPSLTATQRLSLLCSAVDSSPVYENFMRLVIKEEREALLIFIAHSYITLYRKEMNIVAVTLTTAVTADDALKEKVASMVGHGTEVEMLNVVDPSIIGGFICETDSRRLDASVKRQLRDINEQLIKQNRKLV